MLKVIFETHGQEYSQTFLLTSKYTYITKILKSNLITLTKVTNYLKYCNLLFVRSKDYTL